MTDALDAFAAAVEIRLSAALRAEAEAIARAARRRVLSQRDPAQTGASPLADSIQVTGSGLDWVVAAMAPHARFVEFGTRRMPARPFLWPSVAERRGKFITEADQ